MIAMYGHNGSDNHGCEAIVRTTNALIGDDNWLFSAHPDKDYYYEIDKDCCISKQGHNIVSGSLRHLTYKAISIVKHNIDIYTKYSYSGLLRSDKNFDAFFSIGGDNYCYYHMPEMLSYLNKELSLKGPTVLWGCSIEDEVLNSSLVIDDLKRYDLITVRESITKENLEKKGIIDNVVSVTDPAFILPKEEWDLPDFFATREVIGINVSPMIYKYGNGELITENIIELLEEIISKTDCGIALIPHVVCEGNSDCTVIRDVISRIDHRDRIIVIEDMNCKRLKYVISKCCFFVGARTHATIASYSSLVPTLVMGYSVKSRGIAKDIFNDSFDESNFVISVGELKDRYDLSKSFFSAWIQRDAIKKYLNENMDSYISCVYKGEEAYRNIWKK